MIPTQKAAVRILRDARALLARRGCWTKRVSARDKNGNEVNPLSENAVCFCADGAMWHVSGNRYGPTDAARKFMRQAIGGFRLIANWNDEAKSKRTILAGFDRAIAIAERGESN